MNITPRLQVISIGKEDGIAPYRSALINNGINDDSIDIHVSPYGPNKNRSEIIQFIEDCNANPAIAGILGLTPVTAGREKEGIYNAIAPEKDVDCQTEENFQAFLRGEETPFVPGTAEAVRRMIAKENIGNMVVAILGKGPAVGRPLAELYRRDGVECISIESWDKLNKNWQGDLKNSGANVIVGAARDAHCITPDILPKEAAFYVDVAYCDRDDEKGLGNISPEIEIPGIKNYQVGKVTTQVMIEHVKKAHAAMNQK